MKKIAHLICSFVIIIFITECTGYKPIFGSTKLQFEISDYSIEGNTMIGNQIYSKLNNLSKSNKNNNNIRGITFYINSSTEKIGLAKNSAGTIIEYKIVLKSEIQIKDYTSDKNIISETFVSSINYKTQTNYSETLNLENQSIENLINNTFQELLIKLSNNMPQS